MVFPAPPACLVFLFIYCPSTPLVSCLVRHLVPYFCTQDRRMDDLLHSSWFFPHIPACLPFVQLVPFWMLEEDSYCTGPYYPPPFYTPQFLCLLPATLPHLWSLPQLLVCSYSPRMEDGYTCPLADYSVHCSIPIPYPHLPSTPPSILPHHPTYHLPSCLPSPPFPACHSPLVLTPSLPLPFPPSVQEPYACATLYARPS